MSKDLTVLNVLPQEWDKIRLNTGDRNILKHKIYICLRNEKSREMKLGIFRNEEEWELMYNQLKDKIEYCISDTHNKGACDLINIYIKNIEEIILTKSNFYKKTGIDDNLVDNIEQSYDKISQLETKINTLAFMVESLWKANLIMRETLEQHQIPLSEDLSFLVDESIPTEEKITLGGEDIIYDDGLSS